MKMSPPTLGAGGNPMKVLKLLSDLKGYLTLRVGNGGSEKEARQLTAIAQKYLDHTSGKLARLISHHRLTAYSVHLDQSGGGLAATTQAATLNRLKATITYYESTLPSPSKNLPRVITGAPLCRRRQGHRQWIG